MNGWIIEVLPSGNVRIGSRSHLSTVVVGRAEAEAAMTDPAAAAVLLARIER